MEEYTIYCTGEQTKKAYNLGAPLRKFTAGDTLTDSHWVSYNNSEIYTPTAEQMIGWLAEQGIYIIVPIPLIKDFNKKDFSKTDSFEYRIVINGSEVYCGAYLSRKESTIAAIDDALNYLEQTKKTLNYILIY